MITTEERMRVNRRPMPYTDRFPVRPPYRDSNITVVITSFRRPEHLKAAMNSCTVAGMKHVVISASGETVEDIGMQGKIKFRRPDVRINSITDDLGCNEMWLRGVRMVTTEWVHILHDDDTLLPSFLEVESAIKPSIGFVHWPATTRELDSTNPSGVINYLPSHPSGEFGTELLYRHLLKRGTLAISPVQGLFRTKDVITTLEEAERIKSDFMLRPGMMVGNDSLIWLRAIEKYDRFAYVDQPMVSFGCWKGSTTRDDQAHGRGKLVPIYNRTRDYFTSHPVSRWHLDPPAMPPPVARNRMKLIHCVERHQDDRSEYRQRISAAVDSWDGLYDRGVIPAHYSDYRRDSSQVGCKRRLPFLKDVLAHGLELAGPNDILFWTNDDTVLNPGLPEALIQNLRDRPATTARRYGYPSVEPSAYAKNAPLFPASPGDRGGRDLMAFRRSWLEQHWNRIPDYLLGAELWDILMVEMIKATLGVSTKRMGLRDEHWNGELADGYLAHVNHVSEWNVNLMRGTPTPANYYDRTLARTHIATLFPGKTLTDLR